MKTREQATGEVLWGRGRYEKTAQRKKKVAVGRTRKGTRWENVGGTTILTVRYGKTRYETVQEKNSANNYRGRARKHQWKGFLNGPVQCGT